MVLFAKPTTVPLFRVSEHKVVNEQDYANKFTDVTLKVQYQAPSGRLADFWGFYDGDGNGNPKGNIWKMRFMPNEPGLWTYVYSWSDGNKGDRKQRITEKSFC